jgi:hypothetical protein
MIGANLILDFHQEAWGAERPVDDSELAVTAAASIAAFIVEQKQQVGLITNGGDAAERVATQFAYEAESRAEVEAAARRQQESDRLRPVQVPLSRGVSQYLQIMEVLARLEMRDALRLHELIAREYEAWPREATLSIITPAVPPAVAQQIARLQNAGFVVVVLIVRNYEGYLDARARLGGHGVHVLSILGEQDLHVLAAAPF